MVNKFADIVISVLAGVGLGFVLAVIVGSLPGNNFHVCFGSDKFCSKAHKQQHEMLEFRIKQKEEK